MSNYKLHKVNAQHFRGETSEHDNGYKTLPALLREIADYMDNLVISDTEFDHLVISTTFEQPDDSSHYDATLYYRDP